MTFITPSILWGLFAAGIPILIHLFSMRNTKEVEFSTLRFIKELEHETIRKLKLKQWLLVILRVLIIIMLVLMFARPVQRGFAVGWMAGEIESRVAIVVDNSASMAVKSGEYSNLETARKLVPGIISIFEANTNFDIYQTNPFQILFSGGIEKSNEISKAVNEIRQSHDQDYLWQNIDSVLTAGNFDEPNLECFIISDFQDPPGTVFLARNGLDTLQNGWRFYCLKVPAAEYNIALTDVEILNKVRIPNHLLRINSSVSNQGRSNVTNVPIELYLNNERVGQVISDFTSGQTRDFLFQAYADAGGLIAGELTIPEDDYSLDNRLNFNLGIPLEINCKIVGARQSEIHLALTALRSISDINNNLFVETLIDSLPQALFLDGIDVLCLYNPGYLSPIVIEELKTFLARGGGIIWFAGDRTEKNTNLQVEQELNLPHPRKVNLLEGEAFYSVIAVSAQHPLLDDLQLRDLDNELPQVYGYVDVSASKAHQSVLNLNNGRPLLLDIKSGSGRIFYFTSLLDLRWNDLAMRGLIVPLLHRMLMLIATDESNLQPVFVGEEKNIPMDRESLKSEWELVMPSGKRIFILPDYSRENLYIVATDEIGQYQILANGEVYAEFSALLAPHEYISNSTTSQLIISRLPEDRARMIEVEDNLTKVLRDTRFGRSLWRVFLIIAIVLMVLETGIGRINPKSVRKNSDAKS